MRINDLGLSKDGYGLALLLFFVVIVIISRFDYSSGFLLWFVEHASSVVYIVYPGLEHVCGVRSDQNEVFFVFTLIVASMPFQFLYFIYSIPASGLDKYLKPGVNVPDVIIRNFLFLVAVFFVFLAYGNFAISAHEPPRRAIGLILYSFQKYDLGYELTFAFITVSFSYVFVKFFKFLWLYFISRRDV